jgi:hypothetical protein
MSIKKNSKILVASNFEWKNVFLSQFLTKLYNCPELPRKCEMENFMNIHEKFVRKPRLGGFKIDFD